MPAKRGPKARALLLSEQRGELRQQNKSAEGTGEIVAVQMSRQAVCSIPINFSLLATTLLGSAALPFVIPSG